MARKRKYKKREQPYKTNRKIEQIEKQRTRREKQELINIYKTIKKRTNR